MKAKSIGKSMRILPSRLQAAHEERQTLLAAGGTAGLLRLTLTELVQRLAAEQPGAPRSASRLEQELLVERLARMRGDEAPAAFVRHAGHAAAAVDLFGLWSNHGLTPAQTRQWSPSAERPALARFLSRLYGAFREELERGRAANGGMLAAWVAEHLQGEGLPPLLRGLEQIEIRDIVDFSPVQYALLDGIARAGIALDVQLPYFLDKRQLPGMQYVPEDRKTFAWVERTLEEFQQRVSNDEAGNRILLRVDAGKTEGRPEILQRLPSLILDEGESGEEPDLGLSVAEIAPHLRLISAPGRYREVEAIGREVRALLEGRTGAPVAAERIGVVFSDYTRYWEAVADVFTRYNIPLQVRRGVPARATPAIAAVLQRLNWWAGARTPLETAEVLSQTQWPWGELDSEAVRAAQGRIEELLRALAPFRETEDPTLLAERLGAAPQTWPQPLRDAAPTLKAMIEFLEVQGAALAPGQTVEAHAPAERIEALRAQRINAPIGAEEEAAWALLADAAREAGEASMRTGNGRLAAREAVRRLERALEKRFVTPRARRMPGVQVFHLHELRGIEKDYLFVGGMIEGELPAPPPAHPLFGEEERYRMNRVLGHTVFRGRREETDRDALRTIFALEAARERITLTTAHRDEDGRPLLPSIFWSRIAERLGPEVEELKVAGILVREALEEITPPLEAACDLDETMRAMPVEDHDARFDAALEETTGRRGWSALLRGETEVWQARDAWFAAWDEEETPVRPEREGVSGPAARLGYVGADDHGIDPARAPWSATRLDEHGVCAFRGWLHEHGLEEAREGLEGLDPLQRGGLVHQMLEDALRRWREDGDRALEEEVLRATLRESAQTFAERKPPPSAGRWPHEVEVLTETVIAYLRMERRRLDWSRRLQVERRFGFKQPLLLPVGQAAGRPRTIAVKGMIDRLEIIEEGDGVRLRILEYKGSGDASRYEQALRRMGELGFQVPLYAWAARELAREQGIEPECVETHYGIVFQPELLPIPRAPKARKLAEEVERMLAPTAEDESVCLLGRCVGNLLDRIGSGDFAPWSLDNGACATCGYKAICRNSYAARRSF